MSIAIAIRIDIDDNIQQVCKSIHIILIGAANFTCNRQSYHSLAVSIAYKEQMRNNCFVLFFNIFVGVPKNGNSILS